MTAKMVLSLNIILVDLNSLCTVTSAILVLLLVKEISGIVRKPVQVY